MFCLSVRSALHGWVSYQSETALVCGDGNGIGGAAASGVVASGGGLCWRWSWRWCNRGGDVVAFELTLNGEASVKVVADLVVTVSSCHSCCWW